MKRWRALSLVAVLSAGLGAAEQKKADPKGEEKAPSMDKVRWTEAKTSSDLTLQYDYVGGPLNTDYADIRYLYTRRTLLAFLIHGGLEYQRLGFNDRRGLILPGQLESLNAYLALDFRWSKKDLIRIQSRPGLFSDFEDFTWEDFSAPVDIAYTRVVSKRFQWAFGISINTWRNYNVVPGGGFRYYINDQWKLKFMLPNPQIEYKARDNLHVFVGADLRGDTYRLAEDFGTAHGAPQFNSTVVDYSEIRVGPGFSWNIRPLIEFNVHAGVVAQRMFDYHLQGYKVDEGAWSPFLTLNLHWLFKLSPPEKIGPDIESGRFQSPIFKTLFKFL